MQNVPFALTGTGVESGSPWSVPSAHALHGTRVQGGWQRSGCAGAYSTLQPHGRIWDYEGPGASEADHGQDEGPGSPWASDFVHVLLGGGGTGVKGQLAAGKYPSSLVEGDAHPLWTPD